MGSVGDAGLCVSGVSCGVVCMVFEVFLLTGVSYRMGNDN